MLLTRKAEFSASHVCANPGWSEERNHAVYGANANPNGHGHNYVLEVTIEGEPDPVTGMVFDLRELKEILNEEVVEPMDHRFLNREVAPFDSVVPTTENVAIEIWKRLARRIGRKGVGLRNVRLYETSDLFVDYGGEGSADDLYINHGGKP
jgi:6-pyruvoyltetrahydropterin/6-carboxytetrahydropterin synthase